MSEKTSYFQTELIAKTNEIEAKILDISNNIFYNKEVGIILSIIINFIYIYLCYHKTPIISILIFFNFLFLLSHIIISQLNGTK